MWTSLCKRIFFFSHNLYLQSYLHNLHLQSYCKQIGVSISSINLVAVWTKVLPLQLLQTRTALVEQLNFASKAQVLFWNLLFPLGLYLLILFSLLHYRLHNVNVLDIITALYIIHYLILKAYYATFQYLTDSVTMLHFNMEDINGGESLALLLLKLPNRFHY